MVTQEKSFINILILNNMDYKIEVKPTYWEVTLSSGMYSDYSESHLFFAANDESEVWHFLKRYMDSMITEEESWLSGLDSDGTALAMKWNDEKYLSSKFTGYENEIDWDNSYNIADVLIENLKIIYFKE